MSHFTEAEHLKQLRIIDQGRIIIYYLLEGNKIKTNMHILHVLLELN